MTSLFHPGGIKRSLKCGFSDSVVSRQVTISDCPNRQSTPAPIGYDFNVKILNPLICGSTGASKTTYAKPVRAAK
jgi:hypothetical protein